MQLAITHYGALALGAIIGWVLCCMLSMGKYSDMETEMYQLRQENHLLKCKERRVENV